MPKLSITITDEQKTELDDYIKHKKGFRTLADLARFAIYQYVNRNTVKHHGDTLHRAPKGDQMGDIK